MIWQLVSPKDQRIYKIIELLFDSDQTVTINTIAKETNSSIRTIKYELTDLKKFLSVYNGRLISSFDGIIMELPAHIGIDVF
ncbi:HTH domain-containing protein [Jeotgalibaca arthritidis]|uniref:HTH domain-containing protein n=1 Tax=Jeotgalibaca arthritidis TaxID=1868794 RepID=A0A6G7KAQ5_9LACT|nr:HTH domain-containing protein [Jeotgalibaca arthritidis]QII82348.1 HTH domain-containing protein [Jeotgalibaca arthritidis]